MGFARRWRAKPASDASVELGLRPAAEPAGQRHYSFSSGPPNRWTSYGHRRVLGHKSKAFVESFVEDAPPGNKYTTYYGLYVYSDHHDLLMFWGWPLSLSREETIVKGLLAANRF